MEPTIIMCYDHTKVNAFFGQEFAMSNFYPASFVLNDKNRGPMKFESVENFYQFNKAIFFEKWELAEQILRVTAREAKILSKNIKPFIDGAKSEGYWTIRKEEIMKIGVRAKYTQNRELKRMLLATSGFIAEASPHDSFWGTGLHMTDPDFFYLECWGENKLGKLLMQVREEISFYCPY